jgi:ribosomal protein L29
MKKHDIKALDEAGLRQLEIDLARQYHLQRQAVRAGTEKNNSLIKKLRRDLARVFTEQRARKG